MTILLAGATGLVGSRVLALRHDIVPVGRRATGVPGEVVADFVALPALPPALVAVSALGTTIRAVGSQAAFRAVDHAAVLAFARAAQAAGVRRFIVITAVGADAASGVFYSRVKGEVERDLAALGFARLDILQPGLNVGPRAERRPVEALFQALAPLLAPLLLGDLSKYGGISADAVARAVAALCDRTEPGRHVHQNRAIAALAT